ncbi:hypothetical protein ACFE04_020646 [Oxalis oulophora]
MAQSPPNNHNPFTDLRSRLYPRSHRSDLSIISLFGTKPFSLSYCYSVANNFHSHKHNQLFSLSLSTIVSASHPHTTKPLSPMAQSPPNNHNPFTDLRSRLYPRSHRSDLSIISLFGTKPFSLSYCYSVIQSPTIRSSFGNNKDGMLSFYNHTSIKGKYCHDKDKCSVNNLHWQRKAAISLRKAAIDLLVGFKVLCAGADLRV